MACCDVCSLCCENNLKHHRLASTAAVCLAISAKWNEDEEIIPTYTQMSSLTGLVQLEPKVLSLLGWRLNVVVPLEYIHCYLSHVCVYHVDISLPLTLCPVSLWCVSCSS